MSKLDLIAHVSEAAGCTQAEARRMVDIVLGEIENGIRRTRDEGKYSLSSFGVFSISERAARKGRNPQTGKEIDIAARRVLKFKPAANLKDAAGC